jgi:hypothetical protein
VSGKRFGSTIVGAAGQLILTLGGKPFGSTNSIAIVSWLTWAEAKEGDGMIHWGSSSLDGWWILSPVGRCYSWRGTYLWWVS